MPLSALRKDTAAIVPEDNYDKSISRTTTTNRSSSVNMYTHKNPQPERSRRILTNAGTESKKSTVMNGAELASFHLVDGVGPNHFPAPSGQRLRHKPQLSDLRVSDWPSSRSSRSSRNLSSHLRHRVISNDHHEQVIIR